MITVGLGVYSATSYMEDVGPTYTSFMEKCRSAANRNLKLARGRGIRVPCLLLACIVMAMGHGSALV